MRGRQMPGRDALAARVPAPTREVLHRAAEHRMTTLAAGLAFFGLVSLGPAVGAGLALLRLVLPDGQAQALTSALQGLFPETLGLADLIGQMRDRAGRYAGLSLLLLLWPASHLASGWTRALSAVNGAEPPNLEVELAGRLRGLLLGGLLLLGVLLLLAVVAAGTAVYGGQRPVLLAVVVAVGFALQFLFVVGVYHWVAPGHRGLREVWRGALLATIGVTLATAGFAFGIGLAEGLAKRYPPALSTAVVVGLWLYAANMSLLFGDEYNAVE